MATKKILVADDHPVVLEGMRLLFAQNEDYEMVGTSKSIAQTETLCANTNPDLLILDINFQGKNSLDTVPRLKARFPYLKILIFSSYDSPGIIRKALELDVNGYLLKDAPFNEWMEAISVIFKGQQYLSKQLRRKHEFNDLEDYDSFELSQNLSNREIEIILKIVEGKKEQEIGELLSISKNTVHTHKKNILKKLKLHSNAELVRFAYENNLV